jgi:hypothetical protein
MRIVVACIARPTTRQGLAERTPPGSVIARISQMWRNNEATTTNVLQGPSIVPLESAPAVLKMSPNGVRVTEPRGVALPAVAHPSPPTALSGRAGEQPPVRAGEDLLRLLHRLEPGPVARAEGVVTEQVRALAGEVVTSCDPCLPCALLPDAGEIVGVSAVARVPHPARERYDTP